MDALNSLPIWAQVAVGLVVFFLGREIAAQMLEGYTEWRIKLQHERWKREEEAKAADELAAFWAVGPSAVAEAIYWQSFGRSDISTIKATIAGKDEEHLKLWLQRDRFLLPAVEAARAAGIPIAERASWIPAKVQQLKDQFNANPANAHAPWQ